MFNVFMFNIEILNIHCIFLFVYFSKILAFESCELVLLTLYYP